MVSYLKSRVSSFLYYSVPGLLTIILFRTRSLDYYIIPYQSTGLLYYSVPLDYQGWYYTYIIKPEGTVRISATDDRYCFKKHCPLINGTRACDTNFVATTKNLVRPHRFLCHCSRSSVLIFVAQSCGRVKIYVAVSAGDYQFYQAVYQFFKALSVAGRTNFRSIEPVEASQK
uniref:Uncharacterized protein n=1 Tax=Cacopsylla melanoneura TaxID=428564 RepID=A0A8D8TA04_9HEMI